jgi:mycofactocin precursor
MDETTTIDAPVDEVVTTDVSSDDADAVDEELLIEEVSIDGMCGVY